MLNKIFITLILLCGIASADFLDNTNHNLCEVGNEETTVVISCDITENTEQVKRAVLVMGHDASRCVESIYYEDGTKTRVIWFINNNKGVTGYIMRDEYNVVLAKNANEIKAVDIKKRCMERYTQYKEAKNRW